MPSVHDARSNEYIDTLCDDEIYKVYLMVWTLYKFRLADMQTYECMIDIMTDRGW